MYIHIPSHHIKTIDTTEIKLLNTSINVNRLNTPIILSDCLTKQNSTHPRHIPKSKRLGKVKSKLMDISEKAHL